MDLVLIKEGTDEWNAMWERLAQHPINEGLDDPKIAFNQGESWQYMLSSRQGDKVIHSYRHRQHPKDNQRKNVSFYASDKFTDEQIDKVIKVK
jgi:hypothetical protein